MMACIMLYVKAGIKAKIVMLTYGRILGFILFAAASFYFINNAIPRDWWIAVIAGIVLRTFFAKKYYVTGVAPDNDGIGVAYITNWFKKAQCSFANSGSSIKVERLKNWFDCLPKLTIKQDNTEMSFYIVSRDIYDQVKNNVDNNETNIALA